MVREGCDIQAWEVTWGGSIGGQSVRWLGVGRPHPHQILRRLLEQVVILNLSSPGLGNHLNAEQRPEEAKRLMREASVAEDAAGTHPVTPGQILPAREQLGDMLLELGDAKGALIEYERSLVAFPRRFRSHAGAIDAAQRAGDRHAVVRHCEQLLEMAGELGERHDVIAAARELLANPR